LRSLTDERTAFLQRASMLLGDMFFPAALMISSFLRSTIRSAVGLDARDVARMQPAVGVDRLGGGLRRCDSPPSAAGR